MVEAKPTVPLTLELDEREKVAHDVEEYVVAPQTVADGDPVPDSHTVAEIVAEKVSGGEGERGVVGDIDPVFMTRE